MAASYQDLVALRSRDVRYEYSERDTLLYALSIGMGRDPMDRAELRYVHEGYPLRVVPTQAVVVARQRLIWDVGLDVGQFLHGEQKLTIHEPLPVAARLLADAEVAEVYDKGPDKGLILQLTGRVRNRENDKLLFSWSSLIVARADGGIGGSSEKVPPPPALPSRAPDITSATRTRRNQALLYRLNGDRNLVHVDPDVAKRAGFPTPILHGACTYGIVCRDVLAHVCGYDHTRIRTFDVRFTAPVFPGETVRSELWIEGDEMYFRAKVPERDVIVLDHGHCRLGSSLLPPDGSGECIR